MSQTIDQAFIKQYERDVHLEYQRMGSLLRGTVRTKNNVVGSSTTFQKVGTGTAVQKTRHGVVTPMNADHSNVEAVIEDWYAGDWVDKLDEYKTNIDERNILVKIGAAALGRKTDKMIIDQLELTTNSVGDYSTPLTKSLVSQAIEKLNDNKVPQHDRFGLLSPNAWEHFVNITEVKSSEYTGDLYPWLKGMESIRWRNIQWIPFPGSDDEALPLADTDNRDCYIYQMTAVGHAIGSDIETDFDWQGDRVAWFINNMMSMGAILIDTNGVVEIRVDDNTPIT